MEHHHMSAKALKCSFAMKKVEYLGHFISRNGVETDSKKIEDVAKWNIPTSVKDLRSFLGLARYYRKFVKSYAVISKPLTNLLKKGVFTWNQEANKAFEKLKVALTTALVLALPNFSKQFTVETYGSNDGIGQFSCMKIILLPILAGPWVQNNRSCQYMRKNC
ncbi:putative mitochondrial protein AtMg00860 [Silene latifolia]|uniref:putative mitochondrial protein AtMg00860 n=1 Tax=Silene latifolia TaxID=37657 RepID=UPI003D778595